MHNFIVTCDNSDESLGAYFHSCYEDISASIITITPSNLSSLLGVNCTYATIESEIDNLKGVPFIFIGISHGNRNSLVASKSEYINYSNAHRFDNALFYTCACLTALDLGPELQRKGCKGYLGYNKEVKVVIKYYETFIKCKTSGIKFFLQGEHTLLQTYEHMLQLYEIEYHKLNDSGDDAFLAAAFLNSNSKALVALGNLNLTLEDLKAI